MLRNGKSKQKEVHNLPIKSVQETQTERLNNRMTEHISTSTKNHSILKMSNLFVGPLEEIKQKAASTASVEMLSRIEQKMIETQSVIQTKTDMEILKTESGQPRRRRFGTISRDEEVRSSPT
uniref:Uncharacterized protein n=1 Tax=Lactuca sativa TaxID=4236 RepID=A0A9R1VUA8_LACSA|nr:hypothetical protein LSAT_V11C400158190 [Lactuca sativa]